jgi:hypothetical protein
VCASRGLTSGVMWIRCHHRRHRFRCSCVPLTLAPILLSTALLTVATLVVYPFEMATIITLGGNRMVGTYYGLYSTLTGIGIAVGNLLTGAALDTGRALGIPSLPWVALAATGAACALAIRALNRTGHLDPPEPNKIFTSAGQPPKPTKRNARNTL